MMSIVFLIRVSSWTVIIREAIAAYHEWFAILIFIIWPTLWYVWIKADIYKENTGNLADK
jgi:hypothetical protein